MNEKRCSFCQRSEQAVGKLIPSPAQPEGVFICDMCVRVAFALAKKNPENDA